MVVGWALRVYCSPLRTAGIQERRRRSLALRSARADVAMFVIGVRAHSLPHTLARAVPAV